MTADMMADIEPAELGLHFPTFRDVQREAVEMAVYGEERFQGLCIPPGGGKSGIALAIPQLTGWRTLIYTATRGLEDQYMRTGREFEIANVRGKQNYGCYEFEKSRPDLGVMCDDGSRMGCSMVRGNGCQYEETRNFARRSQVVLTNYAFGLTVHSKGQGLMLPADKGGRPFDCLILDEAHLAPNIVRSFLGVLITEKECRELVGAEPVRGEDLVSWIGWANEHLNQVAAEYQVRKAELSVRTKKAVRRDVDIVKRLENLVEKLGRLATAEDGEWICEFREGQRYGRQWDFKIVSPGRFTERFLYMGIPRVILTSATLRKKTMYIMGIGDRESRFYEWPKIFPANRCPVYFIPARSKDGKGISIVRNSTEDNKRRWINLIDNLIEQRMDRKGLIITTSYAYQKELMEKSRWSKYMIGNTADPDSESAIELFERFCKSNPPNVLCSPSFGTGWDFKYDRGEYLIVSKVPLKPPGSASKLIEAILKVDPEYTDYETMQDLVQWCGRIQREEDDQGEVFIVDNSWSWFRGKASKHAPMGFVNSVRSWTSSELPVPLERLNMSDLSRGR